MTADANRHPIQVKVIRNLYRKAKGNGYNNGVTYIDNDFSVTAKPGWEKIIKEQIHEILEIPESVEPKCGF
jgi:hypothetical protein